MAESKKECSVCGDDEDDAKLLMLPCGDHHVCTATSSCLKGYFQQAMKEEKSYPPQCCEEGVLIISDYEDILPWDFQWEYMQKTREYTVSRKSRVYCGHANCANFLHQENYELADKHTVVKCDACKYITCTTCKKGLFDSQPFEGCSNKESDGGAACLNEPGKRCAHCSKLIRTFINEHSCVIPEHDKKFELAALKYAYQICTGCNSTVELAEACNHMSCSCGHQFCYVCGRTWSARWNRCLHGCPQYGKPEYDAEGYNIIGYHRDTGLDRDGRTLMEVEEMVDSEEENDIDDTQWLREQMPGITDDVIETLLALPFEEREMALAQAQFHADARGEVQLGAGAQAAAPIDPALQHPHANDNDGGDGWIGAGEVETPQPPPPGEDRDATHTGNATEQIVVDNDNAEQVPGHATQVSVEEARREAVIVAPAAHDDTTPTADEEAARNLVW